MPDYDPKVARRLQGAILEHPPTLWNEFDALARVPLMVIRGANSDMLASTTLNAMLARRRELEVAVVPDQGHAPLLVEPKLIRRIAAFVASCKHPRATLKGVLTGLPNQEHDGLRSHARTRRAMISPGASR